MQVRFDLVPTSSQSQSLVGGFGRTVYADGELVEVGHNVWHPAMELVEHESVGHDRILDVVPVWRVLHEVSVDVRCEWITVRSYVHLHPPVVHRQPVIDPVCQSDATIERGPGLVEQQPVTTARTLEVATVIYGQPDKTHIRGAVVLDLACLDVVALVFIAVTVRAVRDGAL